MGVDDIAEFHGGGNSVPGCYARRIPGAESQWQQPYLAIADIDNRLGRQGKGRGKNANKLVAAAAASAAAAAASGYAAVEDRRKDGRLYKCPLTETAICFTRNCTVTEGCSWPCPRGLAHVCEFCGKFQHTTMNCRYKPKNYVHPSAPSVPPAADKGAGKGKGGKGKGGKSKSKGKNGKWS